MKFVLIVGDAATFEEDGTHHTEFQSIDFIATFDHYDSAVEAGEKALNDGYDSYVIPSFYQGITTFTAKKEVAA